MSAETIPADATDRSLCLTRLIRAPRAAVWAAWTDPERLPLWWGPRGFSCRTHEIDLRPGGVWRFDMIAPDGTVYPNRHRFTRIDAPEAIDYVLDDDGTGDHHFDAFVRFAEVEGGTEVTLKMVLPDAATRAEVEAFGAVEYGYTTLDCLAEAAVPGLLSITRLVDAPPDRVRLAMTKAPDWAGTGTSVHVLPHGPGTRLVVEQTGIPDAAAHAAGLARLAAALDKLANGVSA